jgi:hypothetical protein
MNLRGYFINTNARLSEAIPTGFIIISLIEQQNDNIFMMKQVLKFGRQVALGYN